MKTLPFIFLLWLAGSFACGNKPATTSGSPGNQSVHTDTAGIQNIQLELVAEHPNQWTGLAVTADNRIFVNFPRWSDTLPMSVGEIRNGVVQPFPDANWNNWKGSGNPPAQKFVCVQSLVADSQGNLWVLDPCNPKFKGVTGSPKLYQFSLKGNMLIREFTFEPTVYSKMSYLNDIRFDEERRIAYITDSGTGAIIVLDLRTGKARRLLDGHPSVHAETGRLQIGPYTWQDTVHSDGLTLNADKSYLYYIALGSHTLYRIRTAVLRNPAENPADKVEKVATVTATDGMWTTRNGAIMLGGLETNSVNRLEGNTSKPVIQDDRIKWADSFAEDQNGYLYFTTSQLHIPKEQRETYKIYRFKAD